MTPAAFTSLLESGPFMGPFYHGSRSTEPFDRFDTKYGSYFSSDRDYAEGYREVGYDFAPEGEEPIPVGEFWIRARNPRVYNIDVEEEFSAYAYHRASSPPDGYDSTALVGDGDDVEVAVWNADDIMPTSKMTLEQARAAGFGVFLR